MANVKRTVYLLTEQQRDALVNYLQDRPFREVASGIQFLINAPTAVLNVESPDEEQSTQDGAVTSESSTLEAVPAIAEPVPV
ncbi:MAG TPA: hypothetical protein V6C78_09110 [Crinalium sp.]|jgi:hypothetical protein